MCRPVGDRTQDRSKSQGRERSARSGDPPASAVRAFPACARAATHSQRENRRQGQQLEAGHSITAKQRKIVRPFRKGSKVEVYSCSQRRWFLDGEVTEIAWESGAVEGVKVSAGSTKIVYGRDKYFTWVESQRLAELVRKPSRPCPTLARKCSRPGPPQEWAGHLNFAWRFSSWSWCYLRIQDGAVFWWDKSSGNSSPKPDGNVQLQGLRLEKTDLSVTLATKEKTHHFQGHTAQAVDAFVAALRAHAAYCEEPKLLRQGARELQALL